VLPVFSATHPGASIASELRLVAGGLDGVKLYVKNLRLRVGNAARSLSQPPVPVARNPWDPTAPTSPSSLPVMLADAANALAAPGLSRNHAGQDVTTRRWQRGSVQDVPGRLAVQRTGDSAAAAAEA
jgi:hypothetical protein